MTRLRVLLGGDLMLGRGIDQCMAQHCDPALVESVVRDARHYRALAERRNGPIPAPLSPAYPWGSALAQIEALRPDRRIVNLETAITTADQPWPAKGVHYRMHPANGAVLQAARLDACSLANNHVLDWGVEGLADTLQVLARCGIQAAGAGVNLAQAQRPAQWPRPGGGRLLLFAWALASSGVPEEWNAQPHRPGVALLPGANTAGLNQILRTIDRWQRSGDRLVVSLHWGGNWVTEIPQAHRWLARQLIDQAGVDVVMGHSSHHPLPPELHNGRLILYGCGDLINDYEGLAPHGTWHSDLVCLYAVDLEASSGALLGLTVLPFALRRFQLQAPSSAELRTLEQALQLDQPPPGWRWSTHPDRWQLEPE